MAQSTYHSQRVIAEARRLLADAATRCHGADRAGEDNVHEVRKDLKKVRAYWRLMRDALGKPASRAGNARCKEAAKQLSAARDHAVMLGTLEAIGADSAPKTAMAVGQARQAVQEVMPGPPTDAIDWDRVQALIRNDDAAWSGLDASAIDADDIKRGWKRTRRKARAYFRASRKTRCEQALHDWRKWVKRELEQDQLLHADRRKRIDRLDRLGELLGTYHDLSVLATRLGRNDRFGGKPQRRVCKSIDRRQQALEEAALKVGRKAFA